MSNASSQGNYWKTTWIIAAIIGFYYTIVIIFSYNFPISDDFALLEFVTNIVTSSDLTASLKLLYTQHNEHIIITTKLVYLLDYWLFNEINFQRLILIGNIFHLGTFYIFIKHSPQNFKQRYYLFIFYACMIFQFGSAESMLWSMAAISNYLVIMLALLTLSLLSTDDFIHYILAILICVLTVFTQGNGILMPFIAILYLISQKRYRDSCIMTTIGLLVVFIYFQYYLVPDIHSNPLDTLHNPGKILIFALSFTGSAFGVGGSHYPVLTTLSLIPTLAVGSLIWAITGYGFYKKIHFDGNIFIWFNVFVILTSIITAMSRINFGLSQSMVFRYHIYSNLATISTVMLVLQLLPIKQYKNHVLERNFKFLAIFSAIYLVATFALVPYFHFIVYSQIRHEGIIYPDKAQAETILEKAKRSGVFTVH
ncbi:MAG TPA: hypothetical protein PLE42_10580 [Candidatus Competibacteraceae bacterium]|nr:hypothetical protein [Candidatus Competibacteraceae bacterium]